VPKISLRAKSRATTRSALSRVPCLDPTVGGELLTIEGVMMPGKGKMTVHGQFARRDEGVDFGGGRLTSVRARGRVRYRAALCSTGRDNPRFTCRRGRPPKDGPSAGVAMATAIVSVMTGIPVRHDVCHDRRESR